MRSLVPGLFFAGLCLTSLSGCASFPRGNPQENSLRFLQTALEATPQQRLRMWQELPPAASTGETRLRRALLLSVPGHPAYDPDRARAELTELGEQFPDSHGVLARTRVAEMRVLQSCHARNFALQKQLDAVADIERDLEDGGS